MATNNNTNGTVGLNINPSFPDTKGTDFESQPTASTSKPMPAIAKAGIAAGSGLVIGVLGSMLVSATIPGSDEGLLIEEDPGEGQENQPADNSGLSDGNIDFAEGVNDDMTFSQAFAAARAEVGAGGAFVWHGTVYGTYTAGEWNSMSEVERQEYSSHFDWNHISSTESTHTAGHTETTPNETGETTGEETEETVTAQEEEENPGTSGQDTEDPTITINSVEVSQSLGMGVVDMNVNGHRGLMIDQDGDGIIDQIIVDANDNGQVDEGEAVDVSEQGILIEDVAQSAGVEVINVDQQHTGGEEETYDEPIEEETGDDDQDIDITDEEAMDI